MTESIFWDKNELALVGRYLQQQNWGRECEMKGEAMKTQTHWYW